MGSLWTTNEVARRLGKTRRQIEYFLEGHTELRPALFGGILAWSEDDVRRLVSAIELATSKRTAKKKTAAG